MKRAHCVSLGCSENMLDGALMGHYLESNDWEMVDTPEDADLIIVNSCGVTKSLEQDSIDAYQHLLSIKRPDARLIFAGCLPAINKNRVREEGYDDVLVTPRRLHLLDSVTDARVPIDTLRSGCVPASSDRLGISFTGTRHQQAQGVIQSVIRALNHIPYMPIPRWLWQFLYYPDTDTEFIRISVGCMNNCSFCSIPKAKGVTRSVSLAVVVERVEDAIRRGKRCIALSCDELASYGQDLGTDIVALLDRITSIGADFRLTLRNIHPEWMLKYWSDLEPIFERQKILYMVMPLQSGSDKILQLMKRNHTASQYRWLIAQIRELSPKTILRTHVMVGFPGETEDDFLETYRFVEELPVDSFCVHSYSERSFTPSAGLPGKVPGAVIDQRFERMQRLGRKCLLKPFRWMPLRP